MQAAARVRGAGRPRALLHHLAVSGGEKLVQLVLTSPWAPPYPPNDAFQRQTNSIWFLFICCGVSLPFPACVVIVTAPPQSLFPPLPTNKDCHGPPSVGDFKEGQPTEKWRQITCG